MNGKKAKAQRKSEPKQVGLVSRLTPAELAYYRKAGTEAEGALAAFNQARAEVQQAQNRLEAAASAFTARQGALVSYADHVLGEVRQLDPAQHTVNEDGAIVRKTKPTDDIPEQVEVNEKAS